MRTGLILKPVFTKALGPVMLVSAMQGLASVAMAEDVIPPALKASINRQHQMSYVGTRTREFRVGPKIIRNVEYITRNGDNIRVEYPRGSDFEGQVIVENASERRHYLPLTNEIRVLPPRREEGLMRLVRLISAPGDKVTAAESDGGRVVGVATRLVTVRDDHGNTVERLSIEPKSGVILKREVFDPVGTRMAYFEFTEIDLTPRIDRSAFTINRKGATIIYPLDDLKRIVRESGFLLKYLPAKTGARLEFARLLTPNDQKIVMQVYVAKDGRYSLFQTRGDIDQDRLRHMSRERSRVQEWKTGAESFVLIGPERSTQFDRFVKLLQGS